MNEFLFASLVALGAAGMTAYAVPDDQSSAGACLDDGATTKIAWCVTGADDRHNIAARPGG